VAMKVEMEVVVRVMRLNTIWEVFVWKTGKGPASRSVGGGPDTA
jgi:hypothetical protein